MAYRVQNEVNNFDFSQSTIDGILIRDDKVSINLLDVILETSCSKNSEFERMGADEFKLILEGKKSISLKRDGYKVYDLNNTFREEIPDVYFENDDMTKELASLSGCPVYNIELNNNNENKSYNVYIDTAEPEISYTISIIADIDSEEWNNHHRIPSELR